MGGRRGDIWGDVNCLLKSPIPVTGPCSPVDGWTLACSWEAGNYSLDLFVCMALAFPIKLSFSQPMSFPAFILLILPRCHWWGSERVVLGCWLGLNHNKCFSLSAMMFTSLMPPKIAVWAGWKTSLMQDASALHFLKKIQTNFNSLNN